MRRLRWTLLGVAVLGCSTPPAETPPAEPVAAAPEVIPPESQPEPTPAPEVLTGTRPTNWPDELAWPGQFDAEHATITEGAVGDLRLHVSVERRDIPTLADGWLAALRDSGYTPRTPCERTETSLICTLHNADRNRLMDIAVEHNPYNEEWSWAQLAFLPEGHVPTSTLPGKCVKPPERARNFHTSFGGVNQDGEYFSSDRDPVVETGPGPDLDGDGNPEVYVPHRKGGDCPWDVPHDVYVMRGTCGHLVGTVVGPVERETFIAPFHKGLREVTTLASWAEQKHNIIPDHVDHMRKYVFDGKRLKKVDEDRRVGRCHHCAAASCWEKK